jgi:hypothetical protein
MSHSTGMSWLKHRRDYQLRFGEPVPDWVCVYDLPIRLQLIRSALRIGWRLPAKVLICDEFHAGAWSVWGFGAG